MNPKPTNLFLLSKKDANSLYLHTKSACVPEEVAGILFVQLTCGLYNLHQRNLLHRDLKPENLLLLTNPLEYDPPKWSECHLKLADFGFSRPLDETLNLGLSVCGTPMYMSPEVLNGGL